MLFLSFVGQNSAVAALMQGIRYLGLVFQPVLGRPVNGGFWYIGRA
jgi:hypothetical protein